MKLQHFQNPPNVYREIPFWSWNDDLDPEELVRQVALMAEAGWGGFFMHARVGLRTPYLGERWMACVRACVEAARERDLGAWLYDEDKWPSGFAGGLSVAPHPDYRAQCLICKVDDRPALIAERIATFAAREVNGRITDVRPAEALILDDPSARVLQFYPQTMPLGAPWFNDYAFIDLLDPAAVRAFLETTHEAYAARFGEDFGHVIPGIFTDEPGVFYRSHDAAQQPAIPWTGAFPDLFESTYSYDLLPHLPALFFDVGDFHRVRYHFWRMVTERFLASFTRQLTAWCANHGIDATGHYNAEDTLASQIPFLGAAMPHYAQMQIPGVDKLGRQINAGAGTVLTMKQLDSVVCQAGKSRALCENYGCSGQDFAHTGRKWLVDWAYVLGINLNNPHLSLYSLRGERKRDYPQNLFYQQPWWPENRLIADYVARLSYVLSQGQRVVDVLVIHPIGSAWTLYRPGATYPVDRLDAALDDLLLGLLRAQRDFHLGDELLMAPGGACEAQVVASEDGSRLRVGEMAYSVVIVPPGVTLAESTVRLLHEFAAAGGTVLAVKPLPSRIDGCRAEGSVLPEAACVVSPAMLLEALDAALPFDVCVLGHPEIWAHHRQVGDTHVYFLVNTARESGSIATVKVRGAGRLEVWDLATGLVQQQPCQQQNGVTRVTLNFPPAGSHLLVRHADQAPVLFRRAPAERVLSQMTLSDAWDLTLDDPNALTLDTVRLRIGEGKWREPQHVLDAHDAIAASGRGTPFALRYTFDAAVRPPGPVYLVVETPERYAVMVNRGRITGDEGWWRDIAFRKLNVTAALQAGRNEILLSGVFGRDMALESVYLVGQFGIEARRRGEEGRYNGQRFDRYAPDFRVVTALERLRARRKGGALCFDLTQQGLPFFAGRVTLQQRVYVPATNGRVVLTFEALRAAVAHVHVNGERVGVTAWPPHEVDVTGAVCEGENVIALELVGTLRNLLGPHHLCGGDRTWTGPAEFRDKSRWTDDYVLAPFGFDDVVLKFFGGS